MSFQLVEITCSLCPESPTTWLTSDRLALHHATVHYRHVADASYARAETESGIVGRARQTPWEPDQTHWVALRIAGRG